MPGPSVISRGNVDIEMLLSVNIAAGTVATNTVTLVTVAVQGLLPGDNVSIEPQQYLWTAAQPAINLPPAASWVATAGVLSVQFINSTGAALTQTTAVQYTLNVTRSANYLAQMPNALPTAIL